MGLWRKGSFDLHQLFCVGLNFMARKTDVSRKRLDTLHRQGIGDVSH